MTRHSHFRISSLKRLPSGKRRTVVEDFLSSLSEAEKARGLYNWDFWSSDEQKIPPGDWVYWLILAGRGADKTRTGAETVRHWIYNEGGCYVLADRSLTASPGAWATRAVNAYRHFKAARIVAEKNFGGAMVEFVIKAGDPNVPIKMVTAWRALAMTWRAPTIEQALYWLVGGCWWSSPGWSAAC